VIRYGEFGRQAQNFPVGLNFLKSCPLVDVMITFSRFWTISCENIGIFSKKKNNVMIKVLHNLALL
jgi:hypothetical protein